MFFTTFLNRVGIVENSLINGIARIWFAVIINNYKAFWFKNTKGPENIGALKNKLF